MCLSSAVKLSNWKRYHQNASYFNSQTNENKTTINTCHSIATKIEEVATVEEELHTVDYRP